MESNTDKTNKKKNDPVVVCIQPDDVEDTGAFDYKGFMQDFRIADAYGPKAIKDTYDRAFNEWKDNVEYFASLVLTLNHQIWIHHGRGNDKTARIYDRLWKQADAWGCEHFTGKDTEYYFQFLD